MGGGFSKQSLADHAANYTFRPLRKKSIVSNSSRENNDIVIPDKSGESTRSSYRNNDSVIPDKSVESTRSSYRNNDSVIPDKSDESTRSRGNNDRVITDCSPSAKLLDNNEGKLLNSDKNPQNIISSPRRSISTPTNLANVIPKLEEKKSIHVSHDLDYNSPIKKAQDENDHKRENDQQEEIDDDYGRRLSDYDGWVGSPSFREYCVKDYLKPNSSTYDGEKIESKTKVVKAKEGQIPMSTKKGRRIRKIKKVISMGNPSGMRNLLHVSACYSPGNAASHEKLVNQIEKTN